MNALHRRAHGHVPRTSADTHDHVHADTVPRITTTRGRRAHTAVCPPPRAQTRRRAYGRGAGWAVGGGGGFARPRTDTPARRDNVMLRARRAYYGYFMDQKLPAQPSRDVTHSENARVRARPVTALWRRRRRRRRRCLAGTHPPDGRLWAVEGEGWWVVATAVLKERSTVVPADGTLEGAQNVFLFRFVDLNLTLFELTAVCASIFTLSRPLFIRINKHQRLPAKRNLQRYAVFPASQKNPVRENGNNFERRDPAGQ